MLLASVFGSADNNYLDLDCAIPEFKWNWKFQKNVYSPTIIERGCAKYGDLLVVK